MSDPNAEAKLKWLLDPLEDVSSVIIQEEIETELCINAPLAQFLRRYLDLRVGLDPFSSGKCSSSVSFPEGA